MGIFDINFSKLATEILPTHKRTDITEVTDSIIEPLNDLNIIFKWFREGNTAGQFNPLTVYAFGQVVRYSRKVYLRNEVTDGYSAGVIPTNATYFVRISENFIGIAERLMYRPDKLVLEYALNRIFETTFRDLPLISDIYIENVNTSDVNFGIGEIDTETATVGETDVLSLYFISENDFIAGETDFIVYVPLAVYNALASNNIERTAIMNDVIKKYRLTGYTYQIQTY
jgi:hypothetical protein